VHRCSVEMIKRVLSDISVSFQHKDTNPSMIPYDLHYRLPRMTSRTECFFRMRNLFSLAEFFFRMRNFFPSQFSQLSDVTTREQEVGNGVKMADKNIYISSALLKQRPWSLSLLRTWERLMKMCGRICWWIVLLLFYH